jgi:hypothetical protein
VEFGVFGFIDDAHASATESFDNAVVSDVLAEHIDGKTTESYGEEKGKSTLRVRGVCAEISEAGVKCPLEVRIRRYIGGVGDDDRLRRLMSSGRKARSVWRGKRHADGIRN